MATSGSYTFTVSRDDICNTAGKVIGKLGDTETFTPTEITDCARFLNMLTKQWMGRQDFAPGLKMWTRYRVDLFLSSTKGVYVLSPTGDNWSAGVAVPLNPNLPNYNIANLLANAPAGSNSLSIGTTAIAGVTPGDFLVLQLQSGDIFSTTASSTNPGAGTLVTAAPIPAAAANAGAFLYNYTTKGQPILEVTSAVLRDSQQNDTPLDFMIVQQYEALPTKVQPGYVSDPSAIYLEPQLTSGSLRSAVLYLDVAGAQDVTKSIHIVALRPVQDFVNPADTPDYPQEWYLPLAMGLGKLICPMFNAKWTQEMQDNLVDAMAIAKETTPETSNVFFQPYAEIFNEHDGG